MQTNLSPASEIFFNAVGRLDEEDNFQKGVGLVDVLLKDLWLCYCYSYNSFHSNEFI